MTRFSGFPEEDNVSYWSTSIDNTFKTPFIFYLLTLEKVVVSQYEFYIENSVGIFQRGIFFRNLKIIVFFVLSCSKFIFSSRSFSNFFISGEEKRWIGC